MFFHIFWLVICVPSYFLVNRCFPIRYFVRIFMKFGIILILLHFIIIWFFIGFMTYFASLEPKSTITWVSRLKIFVYSCFDSGKFDPGRPQNAVLNDYRQLHDTCNIALTWRTGWNIKTIKILWFINEYVSKKYGVKCRVVLDKYFLNFEIIMCGG